MSKLQVLGHRCPVMGKAMAVQSAGLRAFSGQPKAGKARIHTSGLQEARTVDGPIIEARENGSLDMQDV